MSFRPGSEATVDSGVAIQCGEHAGKYGKVRERIGMRILVVPLGPGASWAPFWIDVRDVAVII